MPDINPLKSPLPIRGSLASIYAASLLIVILALGVSLAGVIAPSNLYPSPDLSRVLVSLDVVNLCAGLPVLLVSTWLARRGSLAGLLAWPGALFFVLYLHLIHLFALPYSGAYILHLALTALGVYTVIALVSSIEALPVRDRLRGAIPERLIGVIVAGQGLLNFLWIAAALVLPLTGKMAFNPVGIANHITDILVTPAWMIGGILLWRRQALGYVTGMGLLLQGSLFFVALVIMALWQSYANAAPLAWANLLGMLFVGMICFIPLGFYVRGATSSRLLVQADPSAAAEAA